MARRAQMVLAMAAAGALAVATYWPVQRHAFLNFDDDVYVTANPIVQRGWSAEGVRWSLCAFDAANWHPLTWWSHMLDCDWFGLDAGAHHRTSLLWHAANAALAVLVTHALTGRLGVAAFVGAALAVRPVHIESVAWIAERKDLLCAFFWLLALGAYVRYVRARAPGDAHSRIPAPPHSRIPLTAFRWYAAAWCGLLAALLAKPMAVTLPVVFLVLDWWPLGRLRAVPHGVPNGARVVTRRMAWLVVEKIPFLALSAASVVVTVLAQHGGGAMRTLEQVPFVLRLANALVAAAAYLGKLIWSPVLAVFYPYRGDVAIWRVAGAAVLLAGITAWAWRARARRPGALAGWLWFGVSLLPVIGLVQVGNQSMADRYLYLPGIGATLGAAMLASAWATPPARRRWLTVGAVLLLAAYALETRAQLRHWACNETLYRRALAVTSDNWLAHHNLGVALDADGRTESAIAHMREALRLFPAYGDAHYNLANMLARTGRVQEAEAHYRAALRVNPNHADTLTSYGSLLLGQGALEAALPRLQAAVELAPAMPEAHNNYANALQRAGRADDAMAHYLEALRLAPDYLDARNNLAVALGDQGRWAEAEAHYHRVLTRAPGYVDAWNNLGVSLSAQGRDAEAMAAFQRCLEMMPGHEQARRNLAEALARQAAGKPEAPAADPR